MEILSSFRIRRIFKDLTTTKVSRGIVQIFDRNQILLQMLKSVFAFCDFYSSQISPKHKEFLNVQFYCYTMFAFIKNTVKMYPFHEVTSTAFPALKLRLSELSRWKLGNRAPRMLFGPKKGTLKAVRISKGQSQRLSATTRFLVLWFWFYYIHIVSRPKEMKGKKTNLLYNGFLKGEHFL